MKTRAELKKSLLAEEPFDVVVIGGGVTGAGIALDAALRGLRTALLERADYASGASSKSTKLIHGGLRYLKQLELGLVQEVGRERAIVHRLAPQLVKPEKMLLPLVRGGSLGTWATSLALWVYDALAGVQGRDRRQMLSAAQTLEKEPLLRQDTLLGGGYYAEYRTDDARLTLALLKTAMQQGAVCLNYAPVTRFLYDEAGQLNGLCAEDALAEGEPLEIRARQIISAAGPWVDELRRKDQSLTGKQLFLSKGVHIVVSHERFPLRQAIYFDVPDGRMLFAIPRGRATYIGTTDTPFTDDPNELKVSRADVDYLLAGVNAVFPGLDLQAEEVESSWAGLRPLIFEAGKSASEMSRKDEIFESPSGLLSIAGGKLTGYRKMSERVMARALARLGLAATPSRTAHQSLAGGPFEGQAEVAAYTQQVAVQLKELGLVASRAAYLVNNYGRESERILALMAQNPTSPAERALMLAEARFAIQYEQACWPLDFLIRRSGRFYFDLPASIPYVEDLLQLFAQHFGWTDKKTSFERQVMEKAIFEARNFI